MVACHGFISLKTLKALKMASLIEGKGAALNEGDAGANGGDPYWEASKSLIFPIFSLSFYVFIFIKTRRMVISRLVEGQLAAEKRKSCVLPNTIDFMVPLFS